ncbi:MAG: FHA domain-containing protein [bacterium]
MGSKQIDGSLILIDQQGQTVEITKKSGWALGRDPSNTLVLNDIRASRRHASIRWEGKNYVIRDMDSRNGTFVNSKRIQSAPLNNGDIIRIGDSEFMVRIGEQKQIEYEVLSKRLKISEVDTHTEIDEEFRIHLDGFSGSLKTFSMGEIIQTIMQFQKDGRLKITGYDNKIIAEAFFLKGEVKHASYGKLFGVEAMYSILRLENGVFEFENGVTTPEHTIAESTMGILLEYHRRLDESSRRR